MSRRLKYATVIPLRHRRHTEHVFCPLFVTGRGGICVCQGNYRHPYGVSAR